MTQRIELPRQGMMHALIAPESPVWASDGKTHRLGGIPLGPAHVTFLKHADRTFEVRIAGLLAKEVRLHKPIPEAVREAMPVFMEWDLATGNASMKLLPPLDPNTSEAEKPSRTIQLEGKPLIEAVASDLRFLRDEWGESIDDHGLRRASPVLRRLLVENDLQRGWKAAGFDAEPLIRASALHDVVQNIPLDNILFASAGGAKYQGLAVRAATIFLPQSDRELDAQLEEASQNLGNRLPDELLGLREFVGAPSIIAFGVRIPRRTVIKYVANKLGGAHFDEKRGAKEEDQLFKLLDEISKHIQVAEKNAIFFELLPSDRPSSHLKTFGGSLQQQAEAWLSISLRSAQSRGTV